jgi:hypothetical protein
MRTIVIVCVLAAATACALLFFRGSTPKKIARAADGEEVAALRDQVAELQGHVRYAETLGAAALERQASASRPADSASAKAVAPVPEAPAPSSEPPRNPPTPKQAVARFRSYFDELDALRGPGNDMSLSRKVGDAVDAFDWKLTNGAGPTDKSVTCGNGYCRVKLSFNELQDAENGRTGLSMAAGPVLGRMSIFLDPETKQVEGYFGEKDAYFPPFPEQTVAENAP